MQIPLNNTRDYTGNHYHPSKVYDIEFVAYEKNNSIWDIFIFTDETLSPKFEEKRVDHLHIYCSNINSLENLEETCDKFSVLFGKNFKVKPFYKEEGNRKICSKIYDHLKANNCSGMSVYSEETSWIIALRIKDFPLASKIQKSNM